MFSFCIYCSIRTFFAFPDNKSMEKKHKEALRSKRVFLIENVDPDKIMNHLVQEELISSDDEDEIAGMKRRKEKVRKIIKTLQLRGAEAFDKFIKVLKEANCDFIAKELSEAAKEKGNVLEGRTRPPPPFQSVAVKMETVSSPLSSTETDSANSANQPSVPSSGQLETDAFPVELDVSDYYQEVVTRSAFAHMETDASSDDEVYKMTSKPRGLALIINNRYFDPKCGMNERRGTDVDAQNLMQVFTYLGFTVREVKNQSVKQMKENLRAIARHDHSKYDSVVVAILSHGIEGQVYGSDGDLVEVQSLIRLFSSDNAPQLTGKPKLFFIQACRGDDFDYGQDLPDGRINDEAIEEEAFGSGDDETDANLSSLPVEADMLIAYATVPGYVSWRNSARGSWFVQALCDILTSFSHKEHLTDMLLRVNRRVATSFEAKGRRKQMPSPVVQLLKKLYFRPGL
eukprot:m.307436 g.307436  ORF g.307436 m.307436 type:complete len:457 (+) comp42287_c0_seq1:41-1411(+)